MTAYKTFKLARPKLARYTRRKRTLPVVVGVDHTSGTYKLSGPVDAHVSRFGYQTSRYRRPHDVYILPDGTLAEIKSVAVHIGDDGKPDQYEHAYIPCSRRTIRDRYPHKSISLPGAIVQVIDGLVSQITCKDGESSYTLTSSDPGFDFAVDELGLR